MTIRLLSTYDSFPPQSILTLAPAIEAALIADGNASATLTGGTVAYRERAPVMVQPAVQKHGSVSLIANRKATVPLSEGTALTITPTAGTTGTYQRYDAAGAAADTGAIGAAQKRFGAYAGDSTFEIKCATGSLVAEVRDAVLSAPLSRPGPNFGVMGDSQAQRAFAGTTTAVSGFVYTGTYARGPIHWMLALSGQAIRFGKVAATPSTGCTAATSSVHPTSQEQFAVLMADPTITDVFHWSMVNDIQSVLDAAIDAALASIKYEQELMFDSAIASGRKLHVGTIIPMDTAYGNYTAARQGAILAYNAWLRGLVSRYGKNFIIYDFASVSTQELSKTCNLKTGYSYDKLHNRNVGGYWEGKLGASVLLAQGYRPLQLAYSVGDAQVDETGAAMMPKSTNILKNGMFQGTPISGVAPGWTVAVGGSGTSVVPSVVAASTVVAGALGNAQKLDITLGAAANGFVSLTSDSVSARIPSINSSKLRATGRLTVLANPVGLRNARAEIICSGNVNPQGSWSLHDATEDAALPEGYTATFLVDLDLADWGVTAMGGGAVLAITASGMSVAGTASVAVSEIKFEYV